MNFGLWFMDFGSWVMGHGFTHYEVMHDVMQWVMGYGSSSMGYGLSNSLNSFYLLQEVYF